MTLEKMGLKEALEIIRLRIVKREMENPKDSYDLDYLEMNDLRDSIPGNSFILMLIGIQKATGLGFKDSVYLIKIIMEYKLMEIEREKFNSEFGPGPL